MNRRIGYVIKDFPGGGGEKAAIDIANYLAEQGDKVVFFVINYHPDLFPAGIGRNYKIEQLPHANLQRSKVVAQALREGCLKHGVELLVTHLHLKYTPWLRAETGVKVIYVLHSFPFYEVVLEQERLRSGWRAFAANWPCVVRHFERREVAAYRTTYAESDAFGVLCEGYKQIIIEKLGLSASDNRLHVLPNCTHLPDNVVREKQKTIVFVGRLTRRDKRVDRLLRIWAEASRALPEWTLKIVGDGKDRKNLERLSAELGLERILFEGFSTQVKSYLDEASVACMTSSFEGWPLSVAEAQANGVVPVLFNSFAGASDLVSSPDEGLLIPPFDEHAYARALTALCQDPARLKVM